MKRPQISNLFPCSLYFTPLQTHWLSNVVFFTTLLTLHVRNITTQHHRKSATREALFEVYAEISLHISISSSQNKPLLLLYHEAHKFSPMQIYN